MSKIDISMITTKHRRMFPLVRFAVLLLLLPLLVIGCLTKPTEPSIKIMPVLTPEDSIMISPTASPTAIIPHCTKTILPVEKTPSPSVPFLSACREPSENYEIISINDYLLNIRTYEMLEYAAELYQGAVDITHHAITQGSYTNAVEESFGTHAGGGAVDLSVMAHGTYDILYEEIEPLIRALRLAGFAAWFRDFNDLYEGSPVHIHAIAIGDKDLSPAARAQLISSYGYFQGFDGLPPENGKLNKDPHGGPIICPWMLTLGYPDSIFTPSPME